MSADFRNSFTGWLVRKFAVESALSVAPHLTNVATLPSETLMFFETQCISAFWPWSDIHQSTASYGHDPCTCRRSRLRVGLKGRVKANEQTVGQLTALTYLTDAVGKFVRLHFNTRISVYQGRSDHVLTLALIDSLSMVWRPTKHVIGHILDLQYQVSHGQLR